MKYKIALITLCYNETPIMPFVLDYWKKFVTHAYVFDNGSTDESREILSSHDWISVMDYSHITGHKFDDHANIDIKNNFWKTIKNYYDFVVICDFDECLYCDNWDETCDAMRIYNVSCVIPNNYYNMITEKFPEYKEGKLFHEENKYYTYKTADEINRWFRKPLLFDCKNVYEINIAAGGHTAYPTKMINFQGTNTIAAVDKLVINEFKLYHLVDLGFEYVRNRRLNGGKRMSQQNKDERLGLHYLKKEEDIKTEFDINFNKRQQL